MPPVEITPPIPSGAPENATRGQFNTLVISDVHLGEDLSPTATEATRLQVELVEKHLVQFLRHYTLRREGGLAWRLVINGDLIDFLAISIRPDHPDFNLLGGRADGEDREHGLPRTARNAVAVIEAVAARHTEVFRALARFLARGNRVEMTCGNHDTELTWTTTQDAVRAALERAWAGLPGADMARELIAERVGFHQWFFYEPGVLWIEHGHQYDENCSFEHQLDPVRPGTDEIAMNVDAAGIRYVTNRVRGADTHTLEGWSLLGFLRFGLGLGMRGCLRLALAYLRYNGAMLATWRRNRATRSKRVEQRQAHLERLAKLAVERQIAHDTLAALDGLRKPPVVGHLARVASVLMIDRILVFGVGLAAALAAQTLIAGGLATLVAIAALLVALYGVRRLAQVRSIDNVATLEQAGMQVFDRIDARYVVFGHSHEPVARPVGAEGRVYFNTGTWLPSGRPGILRSFTHLVVRQREAGPVAELCQWRDGMSRAFTPGWRPGVLSPAPAVAALPELASASTGVGTAVTVRAAQID